MSIWCSDWGLHQLCSRLAFFTHQCEAHPCIRYRVCIFRKRGEWCCPNKNAGLPLKLRIKVGASRQEIYQTKRSGSHTIICCQFALSPFKSTALSSQISLFAYANSSMAFCLLARHALSLCSFVVNRRNWVCTWERCFAGDRQSTKVNELSRSNALREVWWLVPLRERLRIKRQYKQFIP